MRIKKLSYEDFLLSLRLSPRLSIEIILEHSQKGILLIRRTKTPFENKWHLPGGFLLKGESIKHCLERLSKDELGQPVKVKKGEFLGLFENVNGDPRGHLLHHVSRFKMKDPKKWTLSSQKKENVFFKRLPQNIIPYQKDFLNKLGYK